jgi:phosphoglycerol transferase MdoB-like AlkP superfamily enzyme
MEIGTNYIRTSFPKTVTLFIKYFILLFSFTFLCRLTFLAVNYSGLNDLNKQYLWRSLYLGTKFDLRLVAILSFPLFLVLALPLFDAIKLKVTKWLLKFILSVLFLFITFAYLSDFGFYAYLNERLSSAALSFLAQPLISARMVWQTYPVIWGAIGVVVLLLGYLKLLERFFKVYERTFQILPLWQRLLSNVFIFFIILGFAYGKFAYYPLRWSEAYFSSDNFISNFTLNPVLNFFDTLKYKNKSYNVENVKKYYPQVASFLGVKNTDNEKLNFVRSVPAKAVQSLDHNIIVIMMESLASNKTSLTENPLDPTPHLKIIADESTVFVNHFTPTEATARGVFATVTSNPDLTLGRGSSSRNPFIINQHSLVNELKHMDKFYFLGGSASWGNIRGIFTNNIKDISVYEEGSYSSPRVDVWGISDVDLFLEADKVLKEKKSPFFAFIQTSGFHRPYTIPDNVSGFKTREWPAGKVKQFGFHSLAEYNSIRLQDHALGEFFKLAKESGYYENTIFVIYGDHGLPSLESKNMPQGFLSHQLVKHHVPLVIHSKQLIAASIKTKIASQVDILPTVLGIVGVPYQIQTLGRDLFDESYDAKRAALIYTWHAKPEKFGIVDKDFLLMSIAGKTSLFKYLSDAPAKDVSAEFPLVKKQLKNLSRGLIETGRYLMYHNKKLE